jgi:leucyl/phenylalanyl-tRNA--protein transferase
MSAAVSPIPWLEPGQSFPPVTSALPRGHDYAGLLTAGGNLDAASLTAAYSQGIFPWFSEGQPILWWSPDPRMVMHVCEFEPRRSLQKTLIKFQADSACEIRIDFAFEKVIQACSESLRHGQSGTWIVKDMIDAYCELHHKGMAHSVETWIKGELVGGLYCVAIGKAVFGESMFSRVSDASKIALSALIGFCKHHGIAIIDCQQKTTHLASLGAREIERQDFVAQILLAREQAPVAWQFDPLYWNQISKQR